MGEMSETFERPHIDAYPINNGRKTHLCLAAFHEDARGTHPDHNLLLK